MAGDNGVKSEEQSITKRICIAIGNDDFIGVKTLFSQYKIEPDAHDDDDMTLLQHACYKGNKEIVQFLLDKGVDVNYTLHQHGYTPLHFAALSGNSDICLSLLLSGAKSHALNSVNRTPSQLAGFVGNHNCVAIINNFIPKSDVDYYTIIRGVETEPKLPPELGDPLYKYLMQINIHPIKLALNIPHVLLTNITKVKKVMDLMCEREMKRGTETNEVLSFKIHYLACVLCEVNNWLDNNSSPAELFAKKILRPHRGEEYLEHFICDCIRKFPFREGILFQQMVKCLSKREDAPSAFSVIVNALNGQRGFTSEDTPCATCGEIRAVKKCSKCKSVHYCDRDCQRLHWFVHKKNCVTSMSNDNQNEELQPNTEEYNKFDETTNINNTFKKLET